MNVPSAVWLRDWYWNRSHPAFLKYSAEGTVRCVLESYRIHKQLAIVLIQANRGFSASRSHDAFPLSRLFVPEVPDEAFPFSRVSVPEIPIRVPEIPTRVDGRIAFDRKVKPVLLDYLCFLSMG